VAVDSLAYCWGINGYGQLGDGTTKEHLTPKRVASTRRFSQVVAASDFSCGLALNHRMYCWGYNGFGELGDGTRTNRSLPVPVAGGLSFQQLGDGIGFHTCGLALSDKAYCWGLNFNGEVGDGIKDDVLLKPVAVVGDHGVRQMSAGFDHTCGVTLNYTAYCWGANDVGQLGDGTTTQRLIPVRVAAPS
jgi:alpha-tubulin suppressor-like RCC1 family protein